TRKTKLEIDQNTQIEKEVVTIQQIEINNQHVTNEAEDRTRTVAENSQHADLEHSSQKT
ncbi:30381_t:CDS:1, partial [Gigaspora margarita]